MSPCKAAAPPAEVCCTAAAPASAALDGALLPPAISAEALVALCHLRQLSGLAISTAAWPSSCSFVAPTQL